jgi:hypothetical protein
MNHLTLASWDSVLTERRYQYTHCAAEFAFYEQIRHHLEQAEHEALLMPPCPWTRRMLPSPRASGD